MKEDLLNQFLAKTVEYLSSAEAFLKAEVPAFIQEFMAWQMYESCFFIGLSFLVLLVGLAVFIKYARRQKEYRATNRNNSSVECDNMMSLGVAIMIVACIPICINTHALIKIKVAPRVFLLEQVRNLTK